VIKKNTSFESAIHISVFKKPTKHTRFFRCSWDYMWNTISDIWLPIWAPQALVLSMKLMITCSHISPSTLLWIRSSSCDEPLLSHLRKNGPIKHLLQLNLQNVTRAFDLLCGLWFLSNILTSLRTLLAWSVSTKVSPFL